MCDGIPVFSESDRYVANYDAIAQDHLRSLARGSSSPFMMEDQIQASDLATRALVKKYLQDGARVLEAGVGCGNLLKGVAGLDRHGVDISLDYLRVARDNGFSVAMSKLSELPYEREWFDGVVACDVLEHLTDCDASVAQLHRVLKPGGILIVRVPNEEDMSSYVLDHRYHYCHVRSFSGASLRLYVEKCFGLEWIESDYCASSFYAASQLLSRAPSMKSPLRSRIPALLRGTRRDRSTLRAALRTLSECLSTSLEHQVDALILLRDHHPAVFRELAPELVRPAELLAVFRRSGQP